MFLTIRFVWENKIIEQSLQNSFLIPQTIQTILAKVSLNRWADHSIPKAGWLRLRDLEGEKMSAVLWPALPGEGSFGSPAFLYHHLKGQTSCVVYECSARNQEKVMYVSEALASFQRARVCWCAQLPALPLPRFAVVEKGSEGMQRVEETSIPEETSLRSENSHHYPKSLFVSFWTFRYGKIYPFP